MRAANGDVVVRGVAIGSCIDGDEWRRDEISHCHYFATTKRHRRNGWHAEGWICIKSPRHLLRRDGKEVSRWILHELAHLLVKRGHTVAWKRVLRELGERVPAQYLTKRRAG